jgi:hypothetical protein
METCRQWEHTLRAAIDRGESDWEWSHARHMRPGTDDDALAGHLALFDIRVQVHALVAEEEVRSRWGENYGAIRLRWAHRDQAYLLRIAIELDGQYLHLYEETPERDQERDRILADRGWYVMHLRGSSMYQELHRPVRERLAALVEQHRRAIILARSDLPALRRNLA